MERYLEVFDVQNKRPALCRGVAFLGGVKFAPSSGLSLGLDDELSLSRRVIG